MSQSGVSVANVWKSTFPTIAEADTNGARNALDAVFPMAIHLGDFALRDLSIDPDFSYHEHGTSSPTERFQNASTDPASFLPGTPPSARGGRRARGYGRGKGGQGDPLGHGRHLHGSPCAYGEP